MTQDFSFDLDSLILLRFIVKMHSFIYLGISEELWATIWEDLQIWESFVGHKVHKILLLRLSRVRKYWLRLGAFDKFSIFGHLCSFCASVAGLCARVIRRHFFPPFLQFADLAPGSFGGLRLISCLSFHISGSRLLFRFVSVPPHLPASVSHLTIHPEKKLCKCPTWPHMLLIRASESVKHGRSHLQGSLYITEIILYFTNSLSPILKHLSNSPSFPCSKFNTFKRQMKSFLYTRRNYFTNNPPCIVYSVTFWHQECVK